VLSRNIVLVEWVDARGISDEWEPRDDPEPMLPVECCSVGFLEEDKPGYVTVAQSVGGELVLGRMTIPRCAIRRVRRLRCR